MKNMLLIFTSLCIIGAIVYGMSIMILSSKQQYIERKKLRDTPIPMTEANYSIVKTHYEMQIWLKINPGWVVIHSSAPSHGDDVTYTLKKKAGANDGN